MQGNNNKENIDFQILKRYLEGIGSEKDASIVRQFLGNPGMEAELQEKSFQFWNEIPLEPDVQEYDGAGTLDRIHHQIKISESVFINRVTPVERFMAYLTRVAAILLIPVLLTSVFFYSKISKSVRVVSYSEIYAPVGTRARFSLPDGSTGWMNGGSSLKFPNYFTGKTRRVEFAGEAYFEVAKNPGKPFIVSTANIDVKVYGTSFNVITYADEPITEVTLESGEAEVFKKRINQVESIGTLKPNQAYIYDNMSDSCSIIPVNSAERILWKDGKLVFKYESFRDVIRKINRWYNVNLVIKDKVLESYVYYGTFEDETFDEVLKLMKLTAPIRYRDLGRKRKPDGTFEKRNIELYSIYPKS